MSHQYLYLESSRLLLASHLYQANIGPPLVFHPCTRVVRNMYVSVSLHTLRRQLQLCANRLLIRYVRHARAPPHEGWQGRDSGSRKNTVRYPHRLTREKVASRAGSDQHTAVKQPR